MTPKEIILAILIPLISGLVSIAVALISSKTNQKNIKLQIYTDMRLQVYKQFESDFATWAHDKTPETTANLYNASNAIRLTGSEETAIAAAKLTDIVRKWETQNRFDAEDLIIAHLTLLKAMRTDLQTQAPKIKRQKQKTGQRV